MSVERQLFPADPRHAPLLRALLALDGSTTRICEAIAQSDITVQLHLQRQTDDVPADVREHLGGERWLERVTSLHAHGRVMMDNLSYTRLDAVPGWFLDGLDAGQAPVGHLLQHLFVKRETRDASDDMAEALWRHVGAPDRRASRCYRVITPESPMMLIFEAWRDGMVRGDRS